MKIIIAGAGAVGTHLAKLLVRERHDITLIDEDPYRVAAMSNNYDIMTVTGSPSSISVLKSAEAGKADLFIAVTPDEAHNMTCCMLASQLGAKRTVARVDNFEYTIPEHKEFFKEAGIDSVIYPELLAGKQIAHNVQHSWVRQWWEFQNGALVLMSVMIRTKDAPVIGKPLKDICLPETPFHIVAIKRDGDTLIPHGNDEIQLGDLVFFMSMPEHIHTIRDISGKADYPEVKNVFFMGGTPTTVHAVENLPAHINAKVFEPDYKRCQKLAELLRPYHALVVQGDGHDLNLLEDEGIRSVQAFVATTSTSDQNILACLAAKRLGVQKSVAMVEDTDYISMAESLNIGSVINKKTFAADHIYQMMLKKDVTSIKSLTIASAEVAEIKVPEDSRVTKKLVKDLGLPPTINLGGLVRNGKAMLINGNTQILAGDMVIAFCMEGEIKNLEKLFKESNWLF